MASIKQTGFYKRLKQVSLLRNMVHKNREIRREIAWTTRAIKSGTFLAAFKSKSATGKMIEQQVLSYNIDLPVLASHETLQEYLTSKGIEYRTGAFCIYLPPQEGLNTLFGEMLVKYPDGAGLKILKDLKPPKEAKYVDREITNVERFNDLTSNSPIELVNVANYLFQHELGPCVYDLVELRTPHNCLTSYIVEDVAGEAPSDAECLGFIEKLKVHFDSHLLAFPNWQNMEDFKCPACKGNLLKNDKSGELKYIDFQSFVIKDNVKYIGEIADTLKDDVHFGEQHWIRGGRYLYQSIPGLHHGQRMIGDRWEVFTELLDNAGVNLEGRVVFDIGCNMGMMIHSALARGARWAVGWDRPYVIPHSRKLLRSLGLTRFNLFHLDIDEKSEFAHQVPSHAVEEKGSVLFYLAMRKHIGFPDGVNRLPFEFILYEGHENETLDDTKEFLKEIEVKWNLDVCGLTTYQDGDSRARSAAVLRRKK